MAKVLSLNEFKLIEENSSSIIFDKGELLFKQGTPVSHIYYIQNGFVKVSFKNKNKDFIERLVKSNNYLGISCLFGSDFYECSAVAIERTEVCIIRKDCFVKLIEQNGLFARKIIEYNSSFELITKKRMYSIIHKHVPGRLADLLLYFAKEVYQKNTISLPLSRNELADFIGTSKKSFIRTLTEFRNDGLVKISGRQIELVRIDLIEKLSKIG